MVKPPFLRTEYNYDMNAAGDASGLKCLDKTLTQQHMKDECDINVLVDRFVVTGEMPQRTLPPMQGDFTRAPTYQEALNLMVKARESFMELPAAIRSRFDNDPAQFVDFTSDEKNRDEMRRMGLWSKEAVDAFEADAKRKDDLRVEKLVQEASDKALRANKVDPKGTT